MARSLWTGAISFGLVTVPVKLYSASSRKTVRFNQLNAATGARIAQKRVDSSTGDEVEYAEIVKGFEIASGRYVVIQPGELEGVQPEKTKSIEIEDFVDLAEIDPIFYDHPYYLAPGPGGAKPYRLLLDAMEAAGKVGIARVVIRQKESLVAVRPMGNVLAMATMLFADEVVDPSTIEDLAGLEKIEGTEKELGIATQLIESLAGPWDPSEIPRQLPRRGDGDDRAQGVRRADHRGAGWRGARERGARRPDGGAQGLHRRRPGPHRRRAGAVEEEARCGEEAAGEEEVLHQEVLAP